MPLACALCLTWAGVSSDGVLAQHDSLSVEEKRGRIIYSTGASDSGEPLSARLGELGLELTGRALACGGCHGVDGQGRPESGVVPTNITWKNLTKAYGHVHTDGTQHGAFNEAGIKSFLRTGIYPGGETADPSMPAFAISESDLDDLIAYLKRLGELPEPGLTDSSLKVGTVLPAQGPASGTILEIVNAYFDALNATGGIFGRRVEFVSKQLDFRSRSAHSDIQQWLATEQPFALVATSTPGYESEFAQSVTAQGVPMVGPIGLETEVHASPDSTVYFLLPGIKEQLLALARFAVERFGNTDIDIVLAYQDSPPLRTVVKAAQADLVGIQGVKTRLLPLEADLANDGLDPSELATAPVTAVVFLGSAEQLAAFLRSTADRVPPLPVLVPGSLTHHAAGSLPRALSQRVYIAYPTVPGDRQAWAMDELASLRDSDRSTQVSDRYAAIAALSAAKVLAEALRQAGRDLTRRKLMDSLNGFYRFETGLTPPITFTRNRRVGASGAHVIKLPGSDQRPQLLGWVEAD